MKISKDKIYTQTQVSAYFKMNNLPVSRNWFHRIRKNKELKFQKMQSARPPRVLYKGSDLIEFIQNKFPGFVVNNLIGKM